MLKGIDPKRHRAEEEESRKLCDHLPLWSDAVRAWCLVTSTVSTSCEVQSTQHPLKLSIFQKATI